jgi:hypothetical protein
MNRHLQEPFTMRKYEGLQEQINEMMIAIKLHHCYPAEKQENPEKWAKAQESVFCPTWENVLELLHKSYKALDEQRYNPIKY